MVLDQGLSGPTEEKMRHGDCFSHTLLLEQSQRPTWLLGFNDGADRSGWNCQLSAFVPFRSEGSSQGSSRQRVPRQGVQQGPSEHIWDQVSNQLQ